MAVTVAETQKSLKIKLQTGTNSSGNPVYSTRTLGDVRPAASNADLFAIANATSDLVNYPIDEISVSTSDVLVN